MFTHRGRYICNKLTLEPRQNRRLIVLVLISSEKEKMCVQVPQEGARLGVAESFVIGSAVHLDGG